MGKDYPGLDVSSALGSVNYDVGEMAQISHVIEQLQTGGQVSSAKVGQSTQLIKISLNHPTYARSSQIVLEATYMLSGALEHQVQIISRLLEPKYADLVSDLLNQADERNLLANALTEQDKQLIIALASEPDTTERGVVLIGLAREACLPSNDEEVDGVVQPDSAGEGPNPLSNHNLSESNIEDIKNDIKNDLAQQADPTSWAESFVADYGEEARPILEQLMMDDNAQFSAIGFQGLLLLGGMQQSQLAIPPSGGDTPIFDNQGPSEHAVDTMALRNLLLNDSTGLTYSSLCTNLGCSPDALQAGLLELIVSR